MLFEPHPQRAVAQRFASDTDHKQGSCGGNVYFVSGRVVVGVIHLLSQTVCITPLFYYVGYGKVDLSCQTKSLAISPPPCRM